MSLPPPDTHVAAAWLGTWSRPPDAPAEVALALGAALLALALVPRGPAWLASALEVTSVGDLARRRRFLTVAAFVAALLSLGYMAFYLRGGPRAPEAPAYWLQARALSHGKIGWTAPAPTASFRAPYLRFSAPDRLAGIFAPGYPLLLAATFLVGAPMLVGPALAAALVPATWLLAREIALGVGEGSARAEAVARVAVGLSLFSAALRYHTADIVPHGAAALAVTLVLACALRARRTHDVRLFGLAGIAAGGLLAIEPVSAPAASAILMTIALGDAQRTKAVALACLGALPGALFLVAVRHATQDPTLACPGASLLAAIMPPTPAHLGLGDAVGATSRRLRAHLLDVANLEPIALLAAVPLIARPRTLAAAAPTVVVAGTLLLDAPFAGPVTSPGAGALALAYLLPIEHALAAWGLARLFPRQLPRAALVTLALAAAGFAVHASRGHEQLAAGGIGRPLYEPDVVRNADVTEGLLFFGDDGGYELASDPGVTASHGIEAVRMRGDDHDRLLYDLLGHPPSHRYIATASGAALSRWAPAASAGDPWRFEAEAEWPPARARGGSATVDEPRQPCVSGGKVLVIGPSDKADLRTPPGTHAGAVMLELPAPPVTYRDSPATPPADRAWWIAPRVLQRGGRGQGALEVRETPDGAPLASWSWSDGSDAPLCVDLTAKRIVLSGRDAHAWLIVGASGGSVALDKITLRRR